MLFINEQVAKPSFFRS